jgi:preprotein translocase subunit SecE
MAFVQNFTEYFKDSYAEMRRVVWPSRNQAIQHTIVVVILSVLVGAFLGLLDLGFSIGIQQLLDLVRS